MMMVRNALQHFQLLEQSYGDCGDTVSVGNMKKLILDWVVKCSEGGWVHSREDPSLLYLKPS